MLSCPSAAILVPHHDVLISCVARSNNFASVWYFTTSMSNLGADLNLHLLASQDIVKSLNPTGGLSFNESDQR